MSTTQPQPIFFGPQRPLRVLTMNIWTFAESYGERMALLREGLHLLDADLLAFQEAGRDETRDQVADLLAGADYHILHQFDVQAPQPPGTCGICLASRFRLEPLELLSLKLTPRAQGYAYAALAARVLAPEPIGSFLFVVAKPSWELHCEYERELQAVAVARLIERWREPKTFPTILAGDFDATPESASMRFFTGRQSLDGMSIYYRDAWAQAGDGTEGHTWTHENNYARGIIDAAFHEPRHARRIDYILLGSGLDYEKRAQFRLCKVALNEPRAGVWPSDHYAVYAEIDPL